MFWRRRCCYFQLCSFFFSCASSRSGPTSLFLSDPAFTATRPSSESLSLDSWDSLIYISGPGICQLPITVASIDHRLSTLVDLRTPDFLPSIFRISIQLFVNFLKYHKRADLRENVVVYQVGKPLFRNQPHGPAWEYIDWKMECCMYLEWPDIRLQTRCPRQESIECSTVSTEEERQV